MNFSSLYSVIILIILEATFLNTGLCAKLYLLEDNVEDLASSGISRLKRQTHPAATIAKLPTQDNNVFTPVVGPTQPLTPQQTFFQNPESFSNNANFPSARDAPVDYLVPPSPNSQVSAQNFQDPSANLQHVDNVFDVNSPSSSSSNTLNSFQSFQNSISSAAPNFQNQINLPSLATTQSSITNDQVQSVSFQNPPLAPPSTPSLLSSPSTTNQFFSNKISNTNREPPILVNQFPPFPSQFANPNTFTRNEPLQPEKPNSGKWDLGFDANEILAPPKDENFGRFNEYDTINVVKSRRPLAASLPSNVQNVQQQSDGLGQTPTNQFSIPNQFTPPSPSQFPSFNSFTQNNLISSNDQFIPVNSPFAPASNQITAPNAQFLRDNSITDQSNIVWGTQKQGPNFGPVTNAPFLPTIPPNNNLQQTNFNPNNVFNSVQNQQLQLPQATHNQFFQVPNVNQNGPVELPLTSQFDSFLSQGTVSEHTFPTLNENLRPFQKRQVYSDEEEAEEHEEEPVPQEKLKSGGVYSFVKTDKDGHFKWSVRHPSRR